MWTINLGRCVLASTFAAAVFVTGCNSNGTTKPNEYGLTGQEDSTTVTRSRYNNYQPGIVTPHGRMYDTVPSVRETAPAGSMQSAPYQPTVITPHGRM